MWPLDINHAPFAKVRLIYAVFFTFVFPTLALPSRACWDIAKLSRRLSPSFDHPFYFRLSLRHEDQKTSASLSVSHGRGHVAVSVIFLIFLEPLFPPPPVGHLCSRW